jgi:alpha-1,3-mannosyltransferase
VHPSLLIITPISLPSTGGIEAWTHSFARELAARGHAVTVCAVSERDGTVKRDTIDGIRYVRLPYRGHAALRFFDWPDDLAGERYSAVVVNDPHASTLSLKACRWALPGNPPRIWVSHGGFFHTQRLGLAKSIHARWLVPRVLRAYSARICISRQDLARFGGLAPTLAFDYLPNGVALAPSPGLPFAERAPGSFVSFGRLYANKRIDLLMGLFSAPALRDAHLAVIGDGPDAPLVKAAAAAHPGITHLGFVERAQLNAAMGRARFFVSMSAFEGFGLSVVEAMSAGAIPLLSDIPAHRTFVEEAKAGLLLDLAAPAEALAQRIAEFAAQPPDHLLAQSERCRLASQQYAWSTVIERWAALFDRLGVARPPSAPANTGTERG